MIRKIGYIVLLLFYSSNIFADDFVNKIAEAFSQSNSAMIASYFDSNIELKIIDNENIYSSQQARVLLINFITDKNPTKFVLKHEGGPISAKYAIGELSTNTEVYRVYFQLKEKNGTPYIYKLRIELNE